MSDKQLIRRKNSPLFVIWLTLVLLSSSSAAASCSCLLRSSSAFRIRETALKASSSSSVFLEGLNQAQKAAVESPINSASLCVAGPGSGKTKVLTHRIGYLLSDEMKQNPGSILAITFTNKAAGEMKERLHNLLGGDRARKCTMLTFHSFAALLLRNYGGDGILRIVTGNRAMNNHFSIWDQDDALKTIKELMKKELGGDDLSEVPIKPISVLNTINKLREAQVMTKYMPEDGSSVADISKEYEGVLSTNGDSSTKLTRLAKTILPSYTEALYGSNALDFEDLLLTSYKLLHMSEVLEKVRVRYRHILVDEYQDTNIPQYEIVRKLAPHKILEEGLVLSEAAASSVVHSDRYDLRSRSLFAVGDRNQAIYSWRGARPSNMLSLTEHYPGLRQYNLMENYRSTSCIIDVANGIIGEDATTTGGETTKREPVRVIATADDEDQAECIASLIETLKRGKTAKKGQYAVMYRTNSQSRVLEQVFVERGIRYVLRGGRRFYDRKEIKDVLCFLRCIANPLDGKSLERAMRDVAKGCGKKTVEAFFQWTERSAQEATSKAVASGVGMSIADALPSPPSPMAHLLYLLEVEEERKSKANITMLFDTQPTLLIDDIHAAMNLDEDASYVSEDSQLTPRERKALLSFATPFFELYSRALTHPLAAVLQYTVMNFVDGVYLHRISKSSDETKDRMANVAELLVAADKYSFAEVEDNNETDDNDVGVERGRAMQRSYASESAKGLKGALPSGALDSFLEDASLLTGEENAAGEQQASGVVSLMTIHASKGLEFDAVFVTGLEEGCLPITRKNPSGDKSKEREALEEERRLTFVAVTRARRLLFLTHRKQAQVFAGGGIKWVKCKPSRFLRPLQDLPKTTVAKMKWKSQG